MQFRKISSRLSVAPQLALADVAEAAAQGFRSIVSNRPDSEADDQPPAAAMAEEAARHGIAFRHLPVVPGEAGEAAVDAFSRHLAELPGPVLAFCRTGTRSVTLWALGEAGRLPADAILATAREAGYDLDALRPRLQSPREGLSAQRGAGR